MGFDNNYIKNFNKILKSDWDISKLSDLEDLDKEGRFCVSTRISKNNQYLIF